MGIRMAVPDGWSRRMNRRDWIALCSAWMLAGREKIRAQTTGGGTQSPQDLPLKEYVPKSMLKVAETHVAKA